MHPYERKRSWLAPKVHPDEGASVYCIFTEEHGDISCLALSIVLFIRACHKNAVSGDCLPLNTLGFPHSTHPLQVHLWLFCKTETCFVVTFPLGRGVSFHCLCLLIGICYKSQFSLICKLHYGADYSFVVNKNIP